MKPGITFAAQPTLFLALVCLVAERLQAEEPAPQSMDAATDDLSETLDRLQGIDPNRWFQFLRKKYADLEGCPGEKLSLLAELAARCAIAAHALLMGEIGDDELMAIVTKADEAAELARASRADSRPVTAPDGAMSRLSEQNDFAGLRGRSDGQSEGEGSEP